MYNCTWCHPPSVLSKALQGRLVCVSSEAKTGWSPNSVHGWATTARRGQPQHPGVTNCGLPCSHWRPFQGARPIIVARNRNERNRNKIEVNEGEHNREDSQRPGNQGVNDQGHGNGHNDSGHPHSRCQYNHVQSICAQYVLSISLWYSTKASPV